MITNGKIRNISFSLRYKVLGEEVTVIHFKVLLWIILSVIGLILILAANQDMSNSIKEIQITVVMPLEMRLLKWTAANSLRFWTLPMSRKWWEPENHLVVSIFPFKALTPIQTDSQQIKYFGNEKYDQDYYCIAINSILKYDGIMSL